MRISKGAQQRANRPEPKPHKRPYHRALGLFQKISAIVDEHGDGATAKPLIAALLVYRSRGHGRGELERKYASRPNKYTPHQGAQECARRVRQEGRALA